MVWAVAPVLLTESLTALKPFGSDIASVLKEGCYTCRPQQPASDHHETGSGGEHSARLTFLLLADGQLCQWVDFLSWHALPYTHDQWDLGCVVQDVTDNHEEAARVAPQTLRLCQLVRALDARFGGALC